MKLNEGIVEVARLFIGKGESGKNNSGFWVNLIRKAWKVYGGGEWCAHFGATCVEMAYYGMGSKPPKIRARSARKFFDRCAKHGKVLKLDDDPQPGDIELRNRPGVGMHIGIVESIDGWCGPRTNIEGNVGRFPARVKQVVRADHRSDEAHVGFVRMNA